MSLDVKLAENLWPQEIQAHPWFRTFYELELLTWIDLFFVSAAYESYPTMNQSALIALAYLFHEFGAGKLYIDINHIQWHAPWKETVEEGIQSLLQSQIPLVHLQKDRLYLHSNWLLQQEFNRLLPLFQSQAYPMIKIETTIEEQRQAILSVLNHPITVVIGGPGTGKSWIARHLIHHVPGPIIVAAPTGKAAANLRGLSQTCLIRTCHFLLSRHRAELAFCSLLIIDEAAMLDAPLLVNVLKHVNLSAHLLFLGDPQQLPPIGIKGLFEQLCLHPAVHTITLNQSLRTQNQTLTQRAQAILKGEPLEYEALMSVEESVALIADTLCFETAMTLSQAFELYQRVRVLTPLKQGPYGTCALNKLLLKQLLAVASSSWIPIVICYNDLDLDLYNGDLAFIHTQDSQHIHCLDGRCLPIALITSYEVAFVLSVHKSQGSEYQEVILLIPPHCAHFGKPLLYTAFTRARQHTKMYADAQTLEKMLQTN